MEWLERQDFLMNTTVEQKIGGEDAAAAAQNAVNEISHLESLMSFFIDSGEVAQINRSAGRKAVCVGKDVMTVLGAAIQFAEISGGAFDITLAPVIDLWRRCGKQSVLPSSKEINTALSFCGYHNLQLDNENNTAFLRGDGCLIDLGAIGKGYAADCCIEIYKAMGIQSAFINLGGNVKTLGNNPDGRPWAIGIQHPDQRRGTFFGALDIQDQSVVTSGAYERYFETGGKKHHHIVDHKTGRPCDSDIKSVTVICQSSMQADCLSTAAFVLGLTDGMDLIGKTDNTEAVFYTENNEIYITRNLPGQFHLQKISRLDCYVCR
ncbi:FAD:protein FMN transferase [Clostridia bacterium]|nr:FAD:protein FMN transferase [Clostridia bacterium]